MEYILNISGYFANPEIFEINPSLFELPITRHEEIRTWWVGNVDL